MIKTWLVRGDCHGNFLWMNDSLTDYKPEETAVIILGDACTNYYLNKSDWKKKRDIENRGYYLYLIRGNHEARPQDVDGMEQMFDPEVHGVVYYEPEFPHIRYFLDYGFYDIDGYTCLIIGGAYSVDKQWRLIRACLTEETNIPKRTGWFANEQLTAEERADCEEMIKAFAATGKIVDFIMTHTCPYSWEPRDMFLNNIDQSTVDETTERWLEEVIKLVPWRMYLFGHFHADRLERPYVEQFFNDLDKLKDIDQRWDRYHSTGELDWWLEKSPMFDEVAEFEQN